MYDLHIVATLIGNLQEITVKELFTPKNIWKVSPLAQIIAVVLLYVLTIFWYKYEVGMTGVVAGIYPMSQHLFFVPIYEEIIFRGIFLGYFLKIYKPFVAIVFVSLLFGIWHLKNIIFHDPIYQMLLTGLVLSPILCFVTLRTRSIWPAVILHYCWNLFIPITNYFFH